MRNSGKNCPGLHFQPGFGIVIIFELRERKENDANGKYVLMYILELGFITSEVSGANNN